MNRDPLTRIVTFGANTFSISCNRSSIYSKFRPAAPKVCAAAALRSPRVNSRPIPAERARYLRESSTGPWVDDWMPRASDDDYRRAWLEAGLTAAAYVPFGPRDEPYGLISAGVSSRGRIVCTAGMAKARAEPMTVSSG